MRILAAVRIEAKDDSNDAVVAFSRALACKPKRKGKHVVWGDVSYDASLDTEYKTFRIDFSDAPVDHIEAVGNTWEELLNRTRDQASSALALAGKSKAKTVLTKLKSL